MPLFALSGTIISAGFIFLLNLLVLNFMWHCFHSPQPSTELRAVTITSTAVTASPSQDKLYYWENETELPGERYVSSHREIRILASGDTYLSIGRYVSPHPTIGFVLEFAAYRFPASFHPFLKSIGFRGPPAVVLS